jgi:predicted glycoside hydrolase/deacetylase ChbG (UPF0249 family)
MKRIAICIDDYGLHEAVDEAILSLIAKGRVTATSCMVGAPSWQYDAARLKDLFDAGRVDAGLHLDLVEYPIEGGLRQPVGAWMRDTLLRRVDTAKVQAEIVSQLDAFEATMGRPPSHVDGHQHVHQFPVVRDLLVAEMARRYPGPQRPWLRSTHGAGRWRFKGRVIEAMGARPLERLAHAQGFAHNRSLLGVYDFRGGPERFRGLLAQWLADARDGDLLMCHVATGIVPGDEIAQPRVHEYEVFAADAFDALVRDAGVQLAPMSAIAAGSAATMAGSRRGG